ncbi:MAG: lysophospholipid acyltransferase family protein [bacterium]|nr:lysophospholipid acyltransferase family protein [bacterium]
MTLYRTLLRWWGVVRALWLDMVALQVTIIVCVSLSLGKWFDTPYRGKLGERLIRVWANAILWIMGVRLVVKNRERFAPDQARVLAVNHSSWLDIPVLIASFPGWLVMIAKDEIRKVPLLGRAMENAGYIFINRSNPREGVKTHTAAALRMKEEALTVVVFPEGTRSATGILGALKPGSFELARLAGVAVQPVAILGTHLIMPKGSIGPVRRGKVEVRVGDPLKIASHLKDARARLKFTREVAEALQALGIITSL